MERKVRNVEIREAIEKKGLRHFEVAELMNVSTYAFSKWLQRELPEEKKKKILEVIENA